MADDIQQIALKEWELANKNIVDKYGYWAFTIMGAAGILASLIASFWHGFQLQTAYVMLFFLSVMFFIGGVRWGMNEMPSKKELEKLYYEEQRLKYDDDTGYKEIAEAKKVNKSEIEEGKWDESKV